VFTVRDNSGRASVVAAVFRRNTRLRHWGPETVSSGAYHVTWRAPARRRLLSFCVQAQDAAGNQSKESCARVKVT
jgi:hypothetical protein